MSFSNNSIGEQLKSLKVNIKTTRQRKIMKSNSVPTGHTPDTCSIPEVYFFIIDCPKQSFLSFK